VRVSSADLSETCAPGALTRQTLTATRIDAPATFSDELYGGGIDDILDKGNGASRQRTVYEANHDLREVVREILDATVPETAEAPGE